MAQIRQPRPDVRLEELASLFDCLSGALPTETKDKSRASQNKSGTSDDLSISGEHGTHKTVKARFWPWC